MSQNHAAPRWQFIALIITTLFVILGFFPYKIMATAKNQDEAISWLYSIQGQSLDVDGAEGVQCVDLILAYYDFLGVPRSSGNGVDYSWNTLPSGWSRVAGGVPQKGDILVYSGGNGHVAIYESDTVTWHQNFSNNKTVQRVTNIRYNGFTNAYWGYIRPNWNTHVHSYTSTVTKAPTCTATGIRTYTCSCGDSYTETIAKIAHSYVNTVVEPTMTERGYTEHTCSVCGYSFKDTYTSQIEFVYPWYYSDILPSGITNDLYIIQYKHTYSKIASTSPGNGWTQQTGSGTTTYVNSGGVYDSDFELATSNTRVYVGSYYYHYCGASTGNNVEHYNDGTHTDYHPIGDINQFYTSGEWADDTDPRYIAYQVRWVSGQWANGLAYCSAGRSAIYYRRYQYQDRVAVTNYTWIKESDWQDTKDSSATSLKYRYRLKDSENPVITSVMVTAVTPSDYTVTCHVTDDIGVARVVFVSWTDGETSANAITHEIVLDTADTYCEVSATISIADHSNEKDVWYHTNVYVYDQAENTAEYSGEDGKVYMPTLIHSSRKLILPENLIEVQASAFETDSAFGEVILPDGATTIGSRAFAECNRLVLVYMPDSVADIAIDAFADNNNVVLLCESNNTAARYARDNGIPYFTGQ